MSKTHHLLVLVLAFLAGLLGAYIGPTVLFKSAVPVDEKTAISPKESTYDRVMRTQTIRCGYSAWPPFLMKDPNSGQISGIFYDYLEVMGKALHLKVDCAEEVGLGDFPAALQTGRIDAMCLTIWPNSSRAREIDFTNPITYSAMYAYVRADDKRFDNKVDAINDPSVMITVIDGEMGALIAANDFPNAKTLQLPQLSNPAELFENVVAKKADILLSDPASAGKYEATHPGQIRAVVSKTPIRVFGNTLGIASGQEKFRRMLNISTGELLSSGQIEKILTKYEEFPGTLLRVAPPYVPAN